MKIVSLNSYLLLLFSMASCMRASELVTVAILAKDKAHTLPLYLSCLERQTWPARNTCLYIRTNNNNDETAQVLREWIERVGDRYAKIYFDDTDVADQVQQFKQHEWNYTRFRICPDTIESMMKTNLPIVAPFLRCHDAEHRYYSNYHDALDSNGYYAPSVFYYDVLDQRVKGIIEMPLVHCTYFIRCEVLDTVCYDDESARYEYVIFADSARSKNVGQYLDNRKIYGYISFAENVEDFEKEGIVIF